MTLGLAGQVDDDGWVLVGLYEFNGDGVSRGYLA
jgi:hypothetical protein